MDDGTLRFSGTNIIICEITISRRSTPFTTSFLCPAVHPKCFTRLCFSGLLRHGPASASDETTLQRYYIFLYPQLWGVS